MSSPGDVYMPDGAHVSTHVHMCAHVRMSGLVG